MPKEGRRKKTEQEHERRKQKGTGASEKRVPGSGKSIISSK